MPVIQEQVEALQTAAIEFARIKIEYNAYVQSGATEFVKRRAMARNLDRARLALIEAASALTSHEFHERDIPKSECCGQKLEQIGVAPTDFKCTGCKRLCWYSGHVVGW